ncbi:glyceraldehyde-3-phosphate dehydrogenase (NADP+) [Fistulifera solaris]|uniref:Succinate-semialdehyde dehydrogenase, mitochondrial n=1 Tax=Fistulifera solaris TaxID=1519565 RepID=A0A1Z5JA79_FISSO|nr:glyceraldehyde-3-phosphate dehydrogenase (NADP+) [Fistulifera solaris]|eukprot:GAX10728.1 glyceraldehyde-3-phosphate dehydrogenase (NADP+) [Fistulifera solaris]
MKLTIATALLIISICGAADAPNVTPQIWSPVSTTFEETAERPWQDVVACCQIDEEADTCLENGSKPFKKVVIGRMPQFTSQDALQVLQVAVQAWDRGTGVWPQMSLAERCRAIEAVFEELAKVREEIVTTLMWEIGKNRKEAEAEFDRTVDFAKQVIQTIKSDDEYKGVWQSIGSTRAIIRRAAIGIIMCLAPYNYPINESYAAMIPALLTGNIILMKIPAVGGLAHLLTMEAFNKVLPPGTVNFVSGSGRKTMPPLMESGLIDGLAFIGGSKAADQLIHSHPHPHRLKVFLQLEANNMGIVLPDVFESEKEALLDNALNEIVLGSLSFNGQRCTALKLIFVPHASAESFALQLAKKVEALRVGLPWQNHAEDSAQPLLSNITPLPNEGRIQYMTSLLTDAVSKGARIMNENGGKIIGGNDSTLMVPAVLYPVTENMEIFHEEQFGPLVPIAPYDSLEQVLKFGKEGPYAQQVSIFTENPKETALILDRFSAIFGKINLNSQCGRSPDTLPFAGRRSSAMGVMSVNDALREFSVPTVVSYKETEGLNHAELAQDMEARSVFLSPVGDQ